MTLGFSAANVVTPAKMARALSKRKGFMQNRIYEKLNGCEVLLNRLKRWVLAGLVIYVRR